MSVYTQKLNEAKGALGVLQDQKKEAEKKVESLTVHLEKGIIPAQAFLQQIAVDTQDTIKIQIKNIVQLALDAVFPNRYEFDIEFELKRGKTEARLFLIKEEEEMDPMNSNGGGVVDILALALRISAYTLSRSRNLIILDEPMKWVSRDLQEQSATIIKELADKVDIQFVITTHVEEIIGVADKLFRIKLGSDDITQVS